MEIKIRREEEKDYREVENVTREAFWNLYFPGCEEHYVVHKMRTHKDFIPEITFVIEVDGKIAGSIFYTHSRLVLSNGEEKSMISFGPVSIHPKYHRQGLGKKLITYSIEKAKELGYSGIFTLGYPYHYEPYGFLGAKKYKISMEDGNYYVGLLALPLYEGAFDNIEGYVVFSEVFEEIDKRELEEFDKNFPYKEKKIEPSQKEFQETANLIDG